MRLFLAATVLVSTPFATPAFAQAPNGREALTQMAFFARDKAVALAQIASVEAAARVTLARAPTDAEALMTLAMATSYRAKLTRNRADALSARDQFEAIVRCNPRDAEAQAACGAWHLNAVVSLGTLMARGALGARKADGLESLDRAIALGGDRALFPALEGLLRLAIDGTDAGAAALLARAAKGSTPTPLDRILQRHAVQLAVVVQGGDAKLIQALAKRLLPLGQIKQ